MYKRQGGNGAVNAFSPIDPDADADVLSSAYPKFGEIPEEEIVDVELGPDDSLFIPKGWWHRVVARTPSFRRVFFFSRAGRSPRDRVVLTGPHTTAFAM